MAAANDDMGTSLIESSNNFVEQNIYKYQGYQDGAASALQPQEILDMFTVFKMQREPEEEQAVNNDQNFWSVAG